MHEVQVQSVCDRAARAAFVDLPYVLHRHDPGWAPPLRRDARALLDPSRNPFYQHADRQLLLARRGRSVVGRIAAIHDRLHLQTHDDAAGFFGFFECTDDQAAAAALFEAAADWLRRRGLRRVRGPMNPSINDEIGLLVDGLRAAGGADDAAQPALLREPAGRPPASSRPRT